MPRTGDGKTTIHAIGCDFNEFMILQMSWPICMSRFGVAVRKISCSWRRPTLWSFAWCRVVVVRIKSHCHKPPTWSTANYSSTMIFVLFKFMHAFLVPNVSHVFAMDQGNLSLPSLVWPVHLGTWHQLPNIKQESASSCMKHPFSQTNSCGSKKKNVMWVICMISCCHTLASLLPCAWMVSCVWELVG